MAQGWVYDDGWFYYDYKGNMLTGWQNIENKWYYLDPSTGYMLTGWVHDPDDHEWYYLNSDGSMATGWINDDGKDYYLYCDKGSMAHDCEMYGYYFDGSGSATKINHAEVVESTISATTKTAKMEFWLFHNEEKYQLPVNPEEVAISFSNDNQEVKVYKSGQLAFWGPPNLTTISFESFFPSPQNGHQYLCAYGDPWDTITMINRWRNDGKPTRLMITNTSINMNCLIDKFEPNPNGGNGDVDFSLSFTEYKTLTIKNSSDGSSSGVSTVSINSTNQTNNTSTPSCNTGSKYTVKEGDSLWLIAKKYYSDGSQWEKIWNANKSNISSGDPNKLSPGEVIIIP